jgi:transposase
MGRSEELGDFEHGLVIGFHISKKSIRDTATLLKLPKSTVGDVAVKWKCEGTTTTKPLLGRPHLMTERDRRVLKKVVRETRQTLSETINCEFRGATNCPASTLTVNQELREVGFHGPTTAHKPTILPVNVKCCLKRCKEWRHWTVDNWAVQWDGLDVANAWGTIPASMCSAKSELWRKWYYSVEVFLMEWIWPSLNTAQKSKHGMIQGNFDSLHTIYGRRLVQ